MELFALGVGTGILICIVAFVALIGLGSQS